jgi:integrase
MTKTVTDQEITSDVCKAVRTTGARYAVWDSELKGFGLRVSAKGVKTFVIRYRVGGGRTGIERMHTIGRYGALTPKEARKRARLALGDVAGGGDPQGGRAHKRAEMTFAELCDLYLAEGCETKKESTLATDNVRIERHIKPLLGRKRVSEIDRADVERFLSDVAAGKTATPVKPSIKALRAKGVNGAALKAAETRKRTDAATTGGKGTATRTLGLVGSILGFAVARRLRPDNPAHGVKRFKDRRCERFLSPAELGRLGAVLDEMEAEGVHPYGLAQIRLLAFTGARRSEIAGLKWREVDLERGALRLETSKTGQKVLNLSPGAAAILAGMTPVAGSPFVFPAGQRKAKSKTKPDEKGEAKSDAKSVKSGGEVEGHYQGVAKVWEAARARADLADVRLHDLRHTFASFGAGGGFGLPVIGALLGHRHAATTQRYAHLSDDPLRKANDWIGGEIGAALERRVI